MPDLMAELQEAEIRARIKRARKEAGLSQSSMADLLGVIPRTIQNYENDHVPWPRITDISDITGVSTRWLLHGDVSAGDDEDALHRIEAKVEEILDRLAGIEIAVGVVRDESGGDEPGDEGRQRPAA